MRKEREIIIKVIKNDRVSKRRLAQFFTKKFMKEKRDVPK